MDLLKEKKKELLSLIADSGILPTIDEIKSYLSADSEKYKTIILIESHFKEVRRRQQQGIIDFEKIHLEENGTRKKLVDLIFDLEQKDTIFSSEKPKPKVEKYGTFKDLRDGQTYRTAKIIGKTWLAQNFNFYVHRDSWIVSDKPGYGRLYSWDAAQEACPSGWRLPTLREVWKLISFAGGNKAVGYGKLIIGGSTGFDARLGGYIEKNNPDIISGFERMGRYWTSSKHKDSNNLAFYYEFWDAWGGRIRDTYTFKEDCYYCRFIRD